VTYSKRRVETPSILSGTAAVSIAAAAKMLEATAEATLTYSKRHVEKNFDPE